MISKAPFSRAPFSDFLSDSNFLSNLSSKMSFSIFSVLRSAYPTWEALHAHLVSKEGGSLRVTVSGRYALISYDKEASNFALAHVPFCRSVVWDTEEHRPANIMPSKTQTGLPAGAPTDYVVEQFLDGVPLGAFFDKQTGYWRLHTRTVMDASNRYYSQTKTFANMAGDADFPALLPHLDKSVGYTFVLQHPENRIVVPIGVPKLVCVQTVRNAESGAFDLVAPSVAPVGVYAIGSSSSSSSRSTPSWDIGCLHNVSAPTWATACVFPKTESHSIPHFRGYMIKNPATGQQWKLVDPLYARVAALRGEGSRLDFRWMTLWTDGFLENYLHYYPEEADAANALVAQWVGLAQPVFDLYRQVFFARTRPLSSVPPKFRSLVSLLHNDYKQYRDATGNRLDLAFTEICLEHCDVKQMIHVLNWDVREAALRAGKPFVPATRPVKVWSDVRFHWDVWMAQIAAGKTVGTSMGRTTATYAPTATATATATATCN